MSIRLRVILIVLLIVCALILMRQTRKKKVDIKFVLPWLILVAVLGILDLFPDLIGKITELTGIVLPINMIFLCGFIFSLSIIYTLTITISKLNDEVKELSQKLAIVEKRLRDSEDVIEEQMNTIDKG